MKAFEAQQEDANAYATVKKKGKNVRGGKPGNRDQEEKPDDKLYLHASYIEFFVSIVFLPLTTFPILPTFQRLRLRPSRLREYVHYLLPSLSLPE